MLNVFLFSPVKKCVDHLCEIFQGFVHAKADNILRPDNVFRKRVFRKIFSYTFLLLNSAKVICIEMSRIWKHYKYINYYTYSRTLAYFKHMPK